MNFQLHGTINANIYVDVRKPIIKLENFVQADINFLPFRNNSFSQVFCHHVIEHLINPIKGITELLRISKNFLEIKTPHRFWKLWDHNRDLSYGHKHHFSVKYFEIVFQHFNAEITITHYKPLIPFFFMSPQEIMIRVNKK